MKSKFLVFLVLTLVFTLLFSSCGKEGGSGESSLSSELNSEIFLSSASEEDSFAEISVTESEEETVSEEPSQESQDEKDDLGTLLAPYAEIIKSGVFTLKTIEAKTVGGVSLPYLTTTCFNGDLVYVIEQESHDSSSEMLVTSEGVYYFNDAEKCVHLMPPWEIEIKLLYVGNVHFEESGNTVVAETAYVYERYLNSNGNRIDFLFSSDGELKKMLLYDENGEYEIVSVSISAEITEGRFEIPEDYQVKDYRKAAVHP